MTHTPTTETASTSTPEKTTSKARTRRRPTKKAECLDEHIVHAVTPNQKEIKTATFTSINVAQLFEMHDAQTGALKVDAKKGKLRAHTIHPSTGESPQSKRVLHATQHHHTPPRAHRTNSTPHAQRQHQRSPVVRMDSSSPTNNAAFATPAYADSPMADELPMPPTFWRGTSPPAPKSASKMTGVELMSRFATGIVN